MISAGIRDVPGQGLGQAALVGGLSGSQAIRSVARNANAMGDALTMDAEQEIRGLLSTYGGALNASDAELCASLYTSDGVFMPHQFLSSAGANVVGAYRQIFAAIALNVEFTIDEVTVDGDLAYALTRSKGTQTILAGDESTPEENRELFVFAKEDGSWKIARYIFNKMR